MTMIGALAHRGTRWLLALSILAAGTTLAQAQSAITLDDAAKTDVERIEAYLNALTTIDSQFVQFSPQGIAEGRIVLSRPDELRIDYEPPVPVLMVASGSLLMYHDRDLLQTTFLPVRETPVAFLLEDDIRLSGDFTITGFERGPASIRVSVVQTKAPDIGSVTLTFEDRPLRLVKWQVRDAQGSDVDVALREPKFGVAVDDDLFSLVDPALGYPDNDLE